MVVKCRLSPCSNTGTSIKRGHKDFLLIVTKEKITFPKSAHKNQKIYIFHTMNSSFDKTFLKKKKRFQSFHDSCQLTKPKDLCQHNVPN